MGNYPAAMFAFGGLHYYYQIAEAESGYQVQGYITNLEGSEIEPVFIVAETCDADRLSVEGGSIISITFNVDGLPLTVSSSDGIEFS